MKEFTYKICDDAGIHARPAGLLVKKAGEFLSDVVIFVNEKQADAKKIFGIMGMGIKKDDTVRVQVSGEDEDLAVIEIEKFFRDNL